MRRILARLRQRHELVVVDTVSQLHDPTLTTLDAADVVLTVNEPCAELVTAR